MFFTFIFLDSLSTSTTSLNIFKSIPASLSFSGVLANNSSASLKNPPTKYGNPQAPKDTISVFS